MDEAQHEDPQSEKRMGWYPDPDDPEKERWWDGKRWTEATQSRTPEPEQTVFPDDFPAIREWKTSIGFSILGIVASLLFWIVLVLLFGFLIESYVGGRFRETTLGRLAGAPAGIVTYALCIIYVAVFYLSYFKNNPRITSSKAISFLNFFFGGVIFGALWNTNLTKSRRRTNPDKGVSYIYAIIISVLAILGVAWTMTTVDMRHIEQAKSYYSELNATYSDTRTYKEAGVSFSIPNGWKEIKLKEDSGFLFAARPLIDGSKSDSYISVSVIEDFPREYYSAMLTDETKTIEAINTIYAPSITNWEDESFGKIELSSYTYLAYTGYGSQVSSDGSTDVFYACCQTFQNENLYTFELRDYEKSAYEYPLLLSSFEDFVSSAEYA